MKLSGGARRKLLDQRGDAIKGTRIKIEANRRMMVFADGERVGSLPAVFTVLPKAIPVVVGPDARAVR